MMNDRGQSALDRLEKPPLHLRLGMVGRRDLSKAGAQLDDVALRGMRLCATALWQHGQQVGSFHRPGPWVFAGITALAEGADQRLAKLWLDLDWTGEGVERRLEVVLPFSRAGYAHTMSGDAAAEMRQLCSRATQLLELADRDPSPEFEPKDAAEKRFRDQRYAALADIIVRQADIVLALWDGAPNVDLGGTPHLISRALRDGVPVLWVDIQSTTMRLLLPKDEPIGDVLLEAMTVEPLPADDELAQEALYKALAPALNPLWQSRKNVVDGTHSPQAAPGGHQGKGIVSAELEAFFGKPEIGPGKSRAAAYNLLLWVTGSWIIVKPNEKVRRQWLKHCPSLAVDCDHVRRSLSDIKQQAGNTWWHFPSEAQAAWGHADALATLLGHRYRSDYVAIFLLGAFAVVVGLLGVPLKEWKWLSVALELVILAIAAVLFYSEKRKRVHDRFMHARGMAEAFRPCFMLWPLGLVGRRIRRTASDWPIWAVQAHVSAAGIAPAVLDAKQLAMLASAMRAHIVGSQINYHTQNAARMHLLDHALERLAQWLVGVAVLSAIVYLFAYYTYGKFIVEPFAGWLTVLLAGIPALAGALATIRYHGDFERFASRSTRTVQALRCIEQELARYEQRAVASEPDVADPFGSLRDILLALESVLLEDLRDWDFVYRVRHTPEPA